MRHSGEHAATTLNDSNAISCTGPFSPGMRQFNSQEFGNVKWPGFPGNASPGMQSLVVLFEHIFDVVLHIVHVCRASVVWWSVWQAPGQLYVYAAWIAGVVYVLSREPHLHHHTCLAGLSTAAVDTSNVSGPFRSGRRLRYTSLPSHLVLYQCLCIYHTDVFVLLVGHRTCDLQVAGSSLGWAPSYSGLGEATYTFVPLVTNQYNLVNCYRPRDSDAVWV